MIFSQRKLVDFLLLMLIGVLIIFSYDVQIQESNAYLGMKKIEYDYLYIVNLLISIVIIFLILPDFSNTTPANIFFGIYVIFPLLTLVFIYGASGFLNSYSYWALFIFQVLSISFIRFGILLAKYIFYRVDLKVYLLSKYIKIEWIFVVFLVFTSFILLQKFEIDFDFVNSYERRLHVRGEISGILAYMMSMGLNGVAPFLAYISALKKKFFLFIVALLFVVIGFGVAGVKAPIVLVVLMWLYGKKHNTSTSTSILRILTWAILIILILSILEFFIFNFSVGMDVVIRRVFATVAQVQGYYGDFYLNYLTTNDVIFGLPGEGKDVTYIIGELYFNNPSTNENTNTFLYEIGRRGLMGYVFMLLFLSCFLAFLDVLYKKYKLKEMSAVSLLYSLIIIEQSYTVALITSGIFFVTVVVFLFSNNKVVR
jgi:hypothetical protein